MLESPLLIIALSAFAALFLGTVGLILYRSRRGYTYRTLNCVRLLRHLPYVRRNAAKAAMLAHMDVEEVDVDSDSVDEELELSPERSSVLGRVSSSADFDAPSAAELVCGSQLFLQLPTEMWLEVLLGTAPFHHHAVSGLRESCHSLRRHLDGTGFWQSLCKQSFAGWAPWMAAVGWEDGFSGPHSGLSARKGLWGGGSVASRAWQRRYVTCCRDEILLRAAARQVALTQTPLPAELQQPPASSDAMPPSPAAAAAAGASTPSLGGPPISPYAAPAARLAEAPSALAPSHAFLTPVPSSTGVSFAADPHGLSELGLLMGSRHGQAAWDASPSCGGRQVHGQNSSSSGTSIHSERGVTGMLSGSLTMRGFHVAELESLRSSWGGRGPSQSRVAKALMKRQQARVDTLLAAISESSHAQRRLVPVWKRVLPEDFAGVMQGRGDAHAHAWFPRLQRLYGLIAGGGAGPPECWVAHLARGEVRMVDPDPEGAARMTSWMLVLCTTRHAVWVDYLHFQRCRW